MPKHRRGSRAARPVSSGPPAVLPAGARPPSFEVLVERALAAIPDRFRPALRDVAIVIEDEASDEELEAGGVRPGGELYGLYQGVPRTAWGADLAMVPNKITLYRLPLEHDFPAPARLAVEVQRTVIHELAHHLGIDDDRLDELGFD
jgi:predicted Zn-dependent protease with MMP-like domain